MQININNVDARTAVKIEEMFYNAIIEMQKGILPGCIDMIIRYKPGYSFFITVYEDDIYITEVSEKTHDIVAQVKITSKMFTTIEIL